MLGTVALIGPDGNPIPIIGNHACAMVAYLAFYPDRTHTRNELSTLFWPEEDPDTSRQRLRQTLYSLRQQITQAFGDSTDVFVTSRTTVGFSAAHIETDVAAFEAAGARAVQSVGSEAHLTLLETALDTYRGEFAPGIYLETILAVQNRLSELHYKLLQLQTRAYEQTDQIAKAIDCAHRALAIDPLAEDAYCDLMRLYHASGQYAAVLRQYQELQRILKTELGEQPGEATRTLFESLRRSGNDTSVSPPKNGVQTPISEESLSIPVLMPTAPHADAPSYAMSSHAVRSHATLNRLLLGALCVMAVLGFVWMRFPRQKRSTPANSRTPAIGIPTPKTLWERRIPLEPGDSDSEPTAMLMATDCLFITGFVLTATKDVDFITAKYDVDGTFKWQMRYDGPSHDVDRARSLSINEQQSSLFVTGESDNGHGNDTTRLSGLDMATIKYSFAGKQLWVARYNGPRNGEDRPCRVIAMADGGCIVAGYSNEGVNPDSSPRFAAVLIGYDTNGKQAWSQRVCASEDLDCRFCDLVVVGGGVVAAGRTYHRTSHGLETEYFLSRYDVNGKTDGKLEWRRQIAANRGYDEHEAKIITDRDGNILVVAPSHNAPESDHGSGVDYLVAKYDSDGNIKWLQNYDGPAHLDDRVRALALTAGDGVAITGESFSAPNDLDIATAQFSADGMPRWANRFAGSGHYADVPNDMIAWKDSVYVTGFTSAARSGDRSVRDMVTVKYDSSGTLLWRALYDGPQHLEDRGICLCADGLGNVIVAGQSYYGPPAVPHPGIVLLKYAR